MIINILFKYLMSVYLKKKCVILLKNLIQRGQKYQSNQNAINSSFHIDI